MAAPAWLLPAALGAAAPGLLGGGKGVSVMTSTTQQVSQSANINVNPIIAVQTPGAHFDPSNNLEPKTQQEQQAIADQSWRQADPGGIYLPGSQTTQFDPLTSEGDIFTEGGESMLSTLTGLPIVLVIGAALLIFVIARKKRRK